MSVQFSYIYSLCALCIPCTFSQHYCLNNVPRSFFFQPGPDQGSHIEFNCNVPFSSRAIPFFFLVCNGIWNFEEPRQLFAMMFLNLDLSTCFLMTRFSLNIFGKNIMEVVCVFLYIPFGGIRHCFVLLLVIPNVITWFLHCKETLFLCNQ